MQSDKAPQTLGWVNWSVDICERLLCGSRLWIGLILKSQEREAGGQAPLFPDILEENISCISMD